MSLMIKLTKTSLQEIVNTYLLANTPKSLLLGMLKSRAVDELRRNCDAPELLEYYDKITAKGERTALIAGLSYAVLVALLTMSSAAREKPDATRLQWGPMIEHYLAERFGTTEKVIITTNPPQPQLIYSSTSTGVTRIPEKRNRPTVLNR